MAICKICGYLDETLSVEWTDWDCDYCINDEINGIYGAYDQAERYLLVNEVVILGSREVR